jgi:hypothetical protein
VAFKLTGLPIFYRRRFWRSPLVRKLASAAFDPSTLFGASDKGFMFDFTNKANLFQDTGKTTPVANVNDPIGYVADLSGKGNNATQSTGTARPLWTGQSGIGDGTKTMAIPSIDLSGGSKVTIVACVKLNTTGNHAAYSHGSSTGGSFMLSSQSAQGNLWMARAFGASAEVDTTNSRGGISANFVVASAIIDLSQATTLTQAIARINGEAYGATASAGPATTGNLAAATGKLFGAYFGNMTGEISRILMINRSLSVSELFNAEYWAGQGGGLSLIAEFPPAGPAYYNLIESYGQSLATGSYGTPVLSSTTRFNDKMFASGVHIDANGGNRASLVPLVESTATESATPEGETPVSGMAEMLHEIGYSNPFIGVTDGFPGETIAQLSKPGSTYTNFLNSVTQAWRRSRDQFQFFKVRAFCWMQGEADQGNASYAANLNTLVNTDLNPDILAITGQAEPVWCLSYQLDRPQIGLAHLAASDTYSNIKVAFPEYFLTHYTDSVHLTNASYKIAGAYFGLAYYNVIVLGNASWQPLRIQSMSRNGVNLDLTYNPVGGLSFDTSTVAAQTQYGFRLFQSDGVTEITGLTVSLLNSTTVRLTAPSSIPAAAQLYVGFTNPAGQSIASVKTNLRDNQGNSIVFNGGGINWPMHNWAVAEQKTVS